MSKPLSQLMDIRFSRRTFIQVGGASMLANACKVPPNVAETELDLGFDFQNLPSGLDDRHHVTEGYTVQCLLRWGDPLTQSVATQPFVPEELTGKEQTQRFGYNNDFLAYLEIKQDEGLLVVNHECTFAGLMFPDEDGYFSKTPSRWPVEMAAHGLSVVYIKLLADKWNVDLSSPLNRRIHMDTPMRISGPAAGHDRLKTFHDPTGTIVKGTVHNCSGGVTPWGTVLSCEENIKYYFHGSRSGLVEERNHKRYGVGGAKAYRWNQIDDRFDLAQNPNEPNRFGWVVEIDPFDSESVPVKRTALGRMFHESANPILNHDGRVVIYMGDDSEFEYLYRFVSEKAYSEGGDCKNLLDKGVLSVARFDENGLLNWLPLIHGQDGLTTENGFNDQADVLIEARRAADVLGGTPMDRAEDIEPSPKTGRVYVNLTKNKSRGKPGVLGAEPANPRVQNKFGHIIEILSPKIGGGFDHAATEMRWEVLLLAGDPTDPSSGAYYGGHKVIDSFFACPDNSTLDPFGRLWISTDGSNETLGIADGLYGIHTSGPHRSMPVRFFSAPVGAEVTGPCFSPDGKNLFLSIQHPGAVKERGFNDPITRWPDHDPSMPPRPAVVVIRKNDGGPIGI